MDVLSVKQPLYCPIEPTSKQLALLSLDSVREVLYGGAGYGGKSWGLLMAACQYLDVPGYHALILRRTFADLAKPGGLIPLAESWFTGKAHWDRDSHTWDFPAGSTITFGYLQSGADQYQYQGGSYQYIGWDELCQFPSDGPYRFLIGWLRKTLDMPAPLRVRSATNPIGPGFDWVKARFVDPGSPGRPFLRASYLDNPFADKAAYVQSLMELDHITRAAIMNGDWSIRRGGMLFKREWFQIVDAVPVGGRRVRYWDLAATEPRHGSDPDWTVGCLMSHMADGLYYVLDIRRLRGTPRTVRAAVRQAAMLDGPAVPIYIEQEPGAAGVDLIDDYVRELAGWIVRADRVGRSNKVARAAPFSAQAEAGNVKIIRAPWNQAFLDEVEIFPMPRLHDDQVDAMSGAFRMLQSGHQGPLPNDTELTTKPEMAGLREKEF